MKYLNTLQDRNGNDVWNKGNDGEGSGLDADLLGGKHASDFYQDGTVIMNTNPFGGKKLYINSINNALFRAESRFTVTVQILNSDNTVYSTPSPSALFNGSYDDSIQIPGGKKLVILIDFNGNFPGYPYGYVYISHYHIYHSASASMRTYSNYEPHGIGWHEYSFSDFIREGSSLIQKARNSAYLISKMEITINAPETTNAWVSEIDFQLDRPGSNEMPLLDKFKQNKMYNHIDMNSYKLLRVGVPTSSTDAVNKEYVDEKIPTKLSELKNDVGFTSNALIQTVSNIAPAGPVVGQVWIQTY
ncbi:hypothetical protein [Clostridium sulfidigenes]|uniref:hypothetical protein n=1 Tax=Clostridium sulfidigenes TaxID=318464 RepID=UPI003F88CA27